VHSKAIFNSAVISQTTIIIIYYFAIFIYPSGEEKLGYLWLNFIGAMLTILLSVVMQMTIFRSQNKNPSSTQITK
jgi:SSS family solute:Na+ symporter